MSEEEIDKYMMEKVSPVLERLVAHLIHKKPDDPVPYMMHYLEKKKGIATAPLSHQEKVELTLLQIESDKLKATLQKLEEMQNDNGEGEEDEDEEEKATKRTKEDDDRSESEADDEDDFVDEIPQTLTQKFPKFRTSVSAEAFGVFNKKAEFKARVIQKDAETKEKIKARLNESFMFANLDDKELKIVIDAMEVKNFDQGDVIIKQKDDGDELFLVGEGKLD